MGDINEDLLRKMANETGGKYWRAPSGKVLEGVFQEINRLEKTKVEINTYTKYAELFRVLAVVRSDLFYGIDFGSLGIQRRHELSFRQHRTFQLLALAVFLLGFAVVAR